MTINLEQMALSLKKAMANIDDIDLAKRLAVEPLFLSDRVVGECNCSMCGDGSEKVSLDRWPPDPLPLGYDEEARQLIKKLEARIKALEDQLRPLDPDEARRWGLRLIKPDRDW
jgi:hypothetical protein